MAVTGFWPVFKNLKATLDYADNPDKTTAPEYLDEDLYAALRYAENDDKTDRKMFVGGINCSAQNAYAEMIAVQRRFGLRGKVVGYHGVQSFREGEVTPEQAFAIGKETARRMWGDRYQVLVTVHLNTDNVHCHFFNEWYAAQTSKKVRAVWAMKAANGKRSNFRVPYGYKRDELDKEKWLVDAAAAGVVRRIYHLCLEGKGPEQIARLLQKEKVLTPTAYYYSVGSSSANRPIPSDPYLWKDSTIDAILSNRKYTGCMVNLKTTTVSYKVHKLIRKPEEEWSIVPNAQEAIIDENTWLRVQELRKHKRRPTATGKTSLFSGLVFCADCGSKLHFCAAKSLKANQEFFRCANYKSGRGECTIHYIRNVVLEQIVSVAVSDLADFVTCHESFFLQMIGKQQSAGKDQNIRSVKSDIAAEKHRVDEIDRLIAKLYEDNFAGKLSDERYSRMAAKYEKEQAELLQSVSTKEKELAELERESVDIRLLLAGLREYSSMETLTPEVVNKIIKRIEVHNSEMVNGHKRVGIDIHFTGVGLVDLATIKEMLAIAESSRS